MSLAFDTTSYLTTYPDVARAVSLGQFASAKEHFDQYGAKELRNPTSWFDAAYYAAQNPDVLNAVSSGVFPSVWAHFLAFGINEGRAPLEALATFDKAIYLAANTDVAAAVANGTMPSALFHYVAFGMDEGRPSGQTFILTTAQDPFTGTSGADVIRGVAGAPVGAQDQTTLNSSDVLDGAGGDDRLVINLTGNYGGGATIKNIETLQLGTNVNAANGAGVTFDYNVNAGAYEVTGVKTIVANQITTGESLTVTNVTPTATGANPIPALTWANEKGSVAGTVGLTYRQAAVNGTADNQAVTLRNVTTGVLNIGAGVETLTLTSAGSDNNTLATSANIDTGINAVAADLISPGSLTKVVLTGAVAIGKAGGVVTSATYTHL
ncbi:MAG TPA: hypothetical protein DEV96_16475, partial [Rhodospirillum rubrum]|nr:hypothetical protein [Rhodospirillum rubrum]